MRRALAGLVLSAIAFVSAALAAGPILAPAAAQEDATTLELAVITAYLDHAVAQARGGSDLAERQAQLSAARRALVAAIASHQPIDLDRVRADVAAQRAAIEARLAEVGRTCGPIPDTTPARARRDALVEVEARLARGPFVPER